MEKYKLELSSSLFDIESIYDLEPCLAFTPPVLGCIFEVGDYPKELGWIPLRDISNYLSERGFYKNDVLIIEKMYGYVVFSDAQRKIKEPSGNSIAIIIEWWWGYGDLIMIYQQIQRFVDEHIKRGHHTHILIFGHEYSVPKWYDFLSEIIKKAKVMYIHSLEPDILRESMINSERYVSHFILPSPNEHSFIHLSEVWEKILGFSELHQFNNLNNIPVCLPSEAEKLLSIIKNRQVKLVGFQFWTYSDSRRSWTQELARKFVEICKLNHIQLVNLTPHPFGEIEGLCDLGSLKIIELFALIKSLDAVVSIDSCCGHIAAAVGIPNITIWGLNSPYFFITNGLPLPKSFRTVQLNYSIYHTSNKSENIDPYIVYLRLKGILTGEIKLKPGRITAKDTLDRLGVEELQ
jgi:hypothetical protein